MTKAMLMCSLMNPAHVATAIGNEAIDACTKEVAQDASSMLTSCIIPFENTLLMSKVAALDFGGKSFNTCWHTEWSVSSCSHCISLFDNTTPRKAVSRAYSDLSRLQCSILTQLRTGHIGFNAYLHRFKLAPSPLCLHCAVPESVPHFLLACPVYRPHRLRLISRLGTARLSLRRLLSSKSEPGPVLAFVCDTGRFPRYAL